MNAPVKSGERLAAVIATHSPDKTIAEMADEIGAHRCYVSATLIRQGLDYKPATMGRSEAAKRRLVRSKQLVEILTEAIEWHDTMWPDRIFRHTLWTQRGRKLLNEIKEVPGP